MKRRDPRRAQWRFEDQFESVEYVEYICSFPCCVCGAPPPCDPSHVEHTRGSRKGRAHHLVPMCRKCHICYGSEGRRTFCERRNGIDLLVIATALYAAYHDPDSVSRETLLGHGHFRFDGALRRYLTTKGLSP